VKSQALTVLTISKNQQLKSMSNIAPFSSCEPCTKYAADKRRF